ncbi:thiolase family protein [Novosphingobium colocasiae]|uniref:propanoyl-CoA C-acyltransferase n=1 Tax=Novosphingobium colocasiae TaxID=1256513 RepID=A0A918P9L3_9SPHN|nr:thiolase family protein [Novosphingobium colocasiae]GGY90857.1 thiolase [Novosphingobium colocasiae]
MKKVAIAGAGMSAFGRRTGAGLRALSMEALDATFRSARGLGFADVERIYVGNAIAGTVVQQTMIKGQVIFRNHPLGEVPLINVENACASSGSAFLLAVEAVASGCVEVALALGVEQMSHTDRTRPFHALRGSTDIDDIGEETPGTEATNSILMEYYAGVARSYLADYGASPEDFARVAVKNRNHAMHNPLAFMRNPQTIEDVLAARMIADPLTLPMCSPITDGAAAVLVCSEERARTLDVPMVVIRACQNASGARNRPVFDSANRAFEWAGLGAKDCDLFELHDAAAPAELTQYADIGLCEAGQGHLLLRDGVTAAGGRYPVNLSGGLLSRGHPLGATGCAQLHEIVTQLRGEAGERQVDNARIAMAVNGGGWLDNSYALTITTILERL